MKNFATQADLKFLKERGISAEEAARQWQLLNEPPQRIVLDRPCTVGDGIEPLSGHDDGPLRNSQRDATERGRWMKFVPASGAASRMFAFRNEQEKREFCKSIHRFAFVEELQSKLAESGQDLSAMVQAEQVDQVIDAVLGPSGLSYSETPKGLVEFHQYADRTRCAFEEHLSEALASLANREGVVRSHFTVAPEHREGFDRRLASFLNEPENGGCGVEFSVQHPATDTIARGGDGQLLRTEAGEPVVRPGGHGALIENLNDLQGDLIFVKNIDNVCHRRKRDASLRWIELVGGYLVRLQAAIHQHLRSLKTGNVRSITAASDFVNLTFPGAVLPDAEDVDRLQAALIRRLSRPLRICGMVKNQGDPGGGPFWVRGNDGSVSAQIVETVEVDDEDELQQAVLRRATHFNPVFMALAVRDEDGKPYDLRQFVDDQRVIITSKPVDGQTVSVLERPGLWNGGMARWNSIFVEVPGEVFSPVKRVFDLLKDEHQAEDSPS